MNKHVIIYLNERNERQILIIESDKKIRQISDRIVLIYGQKITVDGVIQSITTN